MVIPDLAWNIKSWFAMMMHRKSERHDYIRMSSERVATTPAWSEAHSGGRRLEGHVAHQVGGARVRAVAAQHQVDARAELADRVGQRLVLAAGQPWQTPVDAPRRP